MGISGVITDVLVALPSAAGFKSPELRHSHALSDSKFLLHSGFIRSCPSHSTPKLGIGLDKSQVRSLIVRASGSLGGDLAPVAPLQFDSPVGQLLVQILQTHPHLLPAAIDQQLENLQAERDAQGEETHASSQDLLLYKFMHDELIHCKVMVEKMGLPDGLDSGTSKGYGDVLRCCRMWSKIERRIATLMFDRDRKSMGVIVSSSSRRKSLLVKVRNFLKRCKIWSKNSRT